MKGGTHALFGAIAGAYLAHSSGGGTVETVVLVAIGGFSALLPDIDHPNSVIRNRSGIAGDIAFGWMRHRGITHSIIAALLVAVLALTYVPSRTAATAIAVGYASHLLADFITPQGISLFAPIWWKRIGLPVVTTGSLFESFLGMGIAALSLWLIYR